jgi:hypothetical protein
MKGPAISQRKEANNADEHSWLLPSKIRYVIELHSTSRGSALR